MNPILSVIIPIYKVEDYLERCVKSVLDQDYRNLEVILVDDGSPDRCPQICDELIKTDARIKVIHKPNGGLSSARNIGIDIATGEYVTFLDSDDRWAENKLQSIMGQWSGSDIDMVFFKSLNCYQDSVLRDRPDNDFYLNEGEIYNRTEIYPLLICEGNLREQAGTHLVKRSFLVKNNLYFKEGILGEDTEWMFRVMRVVGNMVIVNDYLQIYTSRRLGSITNSINPKSLKDQLLVIRSSVDFYLQHSNVDVKLWELAHCAYLWSTALGYYAMLDKKDRVRYKDELKRLYKLLPMKEHPKARMVCRCYEALGFTFTSYLLKAFIRMRKKDLVRKTKKIK